MKMKIIIFLFIILVIIYKLYKENFNDFYESNYNKLKTNYNKMQNITEENIIITNKLSIQNMNQKDITFYNAQNKKYNLNSNIDNKLHLGFENSISLIFDTSGNCDLSNNNVNNVDIINTFIKNLQVNNLNLNKKIKFPMQNNITNNNTYGIRIWKATMRKIECVEYIKNSNFTTTCKLEKYGDIKLVDENGVQYGINNWVCIAVGHHFLSGKATGVYTYLYKNMWFGSCGQTYTGTFMAIPINYFDYIDINSLKQETSAALSYD
jgi:hypothetical protein